MRLGNCGRSVGVSQSHEALGNDWAVEELQADFVPVVAPIAVLKVAFMNVKKFNCLSDGLELLKHIHPQLVVQILSVGFGIRKVFPIKLQPGFSELIIYFLGDDSGVEAVLEG